MLFKTPPPFSQLVSIAPITNRIRVRRRSSNSKSPSQSNRVRNKSSPRINKSFAAYEDNSPLSLLKDYSSTFRKPRNISISEIRSLRSRKSNFKSVALTTETLETLESQIDEGNVVINNGNYNKAKTIFEDILNIDKVNLVASYNKALSEINQKDYESAICDLLTIMNLNPKFDKKVYLLLCKSYEASNDLYTAAKYITTGISIFSKYGEGYLARGMISVKQGKYKKAIGDFINALKYDMSKEDVYIGLSLSYIGLCDHNKAIKTINKILENPGSSSNYLIERAKLYIYVHNYSKALEDIDKYLQKNYDDPQANFEKALLMLQLKKLSESALLFEQAIKYDKYFSVTIRSIFYLGVIKIKERDFYGALHTFERISEDNEIEDQKHLKKFVEGIIELIKRNYERSISIFTRMLKIDTETFNEYLGSCYSFRAYGNLMLKIYDKSIRDFKKASLISKLDKPSLFNQQVSLGLLAASKKNFAKSTKHFNKAHCMFPRNPDPYILNASLLLCHINESWEYIANNMKIIEELVDKGWSWREKDSDLLFYRSIIKYLNKNYPEALQNSKGAIDESEKNACEHYMIKGLCYAALNMHKEAIDDFSIAIQINENELEAFYYRARCLLLSGNPNEAIDDFQKYISNDTEDQNTHIQAGNIFMVIGSFEDAINAFKAANKIRFDYQNCMNLAKCFIILNKLVEATNELSQALKYNDSLMINRDIEILKYLSDLISQPMSKTSLFQASLYINDILSSYQGELFDSKSLHLLRGVFLMYSDDYQQAVNEFQQILEEIQLKDVNTMCADEALIMEEENCEVLFNIAICYLNVTEI